MNKSYCIAYTVLTHLAIVALEALLYGFMLMRNNFGDILSGFVTSLEDTFS